MNKTKPVRQLKRETLVRKVRELERTVGVYSTIIEHRNMSIDMFKQKIERQKRQHSRAIRGVEIERDEWRLMAAEEARLRLHVQHDYRVSNCRWEEEEEPDKMAVETDDTDERPVAKKPDG